MSYLVLFYEIKEVFLYHLLVLKWHYILQEIAVRSDDGIQCYMSYCSKSRIKLLKNPRNSNYSFIIPPYNKENVVSLCFDWCVEEKTKATKL